MTDIPEVKGFATYNVNKEPVAFINGHDLATWLRSPKHDLTLQQKQATDMIADIIESLSDELLRRDLGL